jgi:hypothetical protein
MAGKAQDGVAVLWQKAIDDYNNNQKLTSLDKMPRVNNLNNIDELFEFRGLQSRNFLRMRNEGGKLAWLRTKIKNCLVLSTL